MYLDRTCIAEASGAIRRELHLDQAQMGWVLAAFSFGYLLFEIPSALAAHRYGARIWFVRIMATWGLATLLLALTS